MKIYKSTRAKTYFDTLGYTYISCKKNENGVYEYICSDDVETHCFYLTFADTAFIILKHSVGSIRFVPSDVISDTAEIVNQ